MSRHRPEVRPIDPARVMNLTKSLQDIAAAVRSFSTGSAYVTASDDAEVVTRTLVLANEKSTNAEIAAAIPRHNLSHGVAHSPFDYSALLHKYPDFRNAVIEFWRSSAEDREWFHDALISITAKKKPEVAALRSEINGLLDDIVILPKLTWTGSALQRDDMFFALSTKASMGYTLMLLLDKGRGLTSKLQQCKLRECGRFFLSMSTGGRPPLYCCRDHQTEYAASTGAARTERWRKELRKRNQVTAGKRTKRTKR